jgi:hypothetical protein
MVGKTGQVGQSHGQQGKRAGAQAGEQSTSENGSKGERTWMGKAALEELFAAPCQVGKLQGEAGHCQGE